MVWYSSISLRPSSKRSGHRISYASTNRAYRNRLMYSYNSGLNDKGWAISACLSARTSDEGYIEGTYYSAMSYLLGIEKKIWKVLFFNIGVNSIMRSSPSQQIEFITFPALNLNIRY